MILPAATVRCPRDAAGDSRGARDGDLWRADDVHRGARASGFSRFDLSSLRTGVMAGAPCPVEVMKRVVNDMHCTGMTVVYGQTESSPVITMSGVDDGWSSGCRRSGSVPEHRGQDRFAANGETVRGRRARRVVHARLPGDEGLRSGTGGHGARDRRGRLAAHRRPGDDGHDGYFRITGRAKDMIIRGGENIYPREMEEFLHTHPKIADVQVVGLPDARLGEAVAAWIRLKEPAEEDEIREFCRGKIAHFKVPQYIRFVDAFPMTVTGKIQKFRIREIEIQDRGLEDAARIQTA